ncbi:MAG: VOC family protein [Kiloniellales bacterium]|nr:VOC family protein [Kiloniellales bacterium]
MLNILGLDHVVIRVRDLECMIAFYRDVLSCTEERRLDTIGLVQLRAGRSLIDLVDAAGEIGRAGGAAPGEGGGNMDHFCVRVEPFDEAALRAHLESRGVEVGEVVSRYGAEGSGPSLYISDPEGNTVELKGPPETPSTA